MFRLVRLAVVLCFTATASAADPPVQLLLPSRVLQPDSTFELRFASRDGAGGWNWQTRRRFAAGAGPGCARSLHLAEQAQRQLCAGGVLPLGTIFKISLRPGTKDAAGREVRATLRETAETPPFRMKGENALELCGSSTMPRSCRVFSSFLTPMWMPARAAKFCRFVNAAGTRIEARVEQASDQTKSRSQSSRPSAVTTSRSQSGARKSRRRHCHPRRKKMKTPCRIPGKAPPPRGNILYIAPVKPLPPGANWRLVLDRGLPCHRHENHPAVRTGNPDRRRAALRRHRGRGREQPHRGPPPHPQVQQIARRGRFGGFVRQMDQSRPSGAEPEGDQGRQQHHD